MVYQAYRSSIADWALLHGRLGGPEFSLSRMSWIKPNFLWMMYRSGWGTKENQEGVLGLRLRRSFFDHVLSGAVASTMGASPYSSPSDWQAALSRSTVRLQWDPDHAPSGAPVERRAVQLGLRGPTLLELTQPPALVEVIDMRALVAEQRTLLERGRIEELRTPSEDVYHAPPEAARCIGISPPGAEDG